MQMYKAIRYIGSKQNILPFLEENLFCHLKENDTFFDGFSGTGIVSQHIQEKQNNIKISGGDLSLYSKILFNILNISYAFKNNEEIINIIKEFEKKELISGDIFNEFSKNGIPKTYSENRLFFHELSGKTIDTFKYFLFEKIKNNKITKEQNDILYFILISYACKIANTTSVFGAYLKSEPKYIPLNQNFVQKILDNLSKITQNKNKASFYLNDIVENLKQIPKQNMIYLDPPYSTRRYESNYHILNYIANPEFSYTELKSNSKTGQPIFISKNPFSQKKQTEKIFENMILEAIKKTDILAISYNTDGIITNQWMNNFCQKYNLNLDTKLQSYKRFKSKIENKNINELLEILWIIKK